MISFAFEDLSPFGIVEDKFSLWITDVLKVENKILGDLAFVFVSDAFILKMNQDYLKHDYYTDIITFDYTEDNIVSGDLFISLDTVNSNSKDLNLSLAEELSRVCVHGVLHLCGYGDKEETQTKLMRSKEDTALNLPSFSEFFSF